MGRIFLTGSSGHVGGFLSDYFSHREYDVININRNRSEGVCNTNCLTYEDLDTLLEGISVESDDILIHCAAVIDYNNLNVGLSEFNSYYFHKLLVAFKLAGLKRVVLISSAPWSGTSKTAINEHMPPNPQSIYHLSKFYQEKTLELLDFKNYYSLRLSSPVSEFMTRKTLFYSFVEKAMRHENIEVFGKGTRKQDYICLEDLAMLVNRLYRSNEWRNGSYVIASGHSISNIELAKKVKITLNSKSEILFKGEDDQEGLKWLYDISSAKENLKFDPQHRLEAVIVALSKNISR